MADNPERALLADILKRGGTDVPVRTNPVFADLDARIAKLEPGRVTLHFHAGDRARQSDGIVHGGMVSAMLDGSMAFAVMSRLAEGETTATISLTVNFLSAARDGACRAEAAIERLGRRVAFTRATLTSTDGKPVASATASFAVIPAPAGG